MAHELGCAALPRGIRGTAPGGALPAFAAVGSAPEFLPDDARRLSSMARRVEKVSCRESRRDSEGGRLFGRHRQARAESEYEKGFPERPRDSCVGRRSLPRFLGTPVGGIGGPNGGR